MKKITLDYGGNNELVIQDTENEIDFLVGDRSIEGLELPDVETSSFKLPSQDGDFLSSHYYRGRSIGLSITVKGATAATYLDNRILLESALSLTRNDKGAATLKTARFEEVDGTVYEVFYSLTRMTLPRQYVGHATGTLILYCPDPSLFGESATDAATLREGGGFDISPMEPSYRMSGKFTGGMAAASNSAAVSFGSATDFSIAFWLKTTHSGSSREIIQRGSGSAYLLCVVNASDGASIEMHDGSGYFGASTGGTVNDGDWHHCCFTADRDGNATAYIDNVAGTPASISSLGDISPSSSQLRIMRGFFFGTNLQGSLAALRMWDKVLTTDEIAQDFGGFRVDDSLVAEYMFSGVVRTQPPPTIIDSSTSLASSFDMRDTSVTANHGYLYGGAEPVADVPAVGDASVGGFDITFDISASVGGSVVLNNAGNAHSYPILTIRGAASNPTVTNQATGKSMTLSGANLAAGESITADMKNRTIRKGNQNLFALKTDDSEFWTLQPGNNTILFTDTAFSATAQVTISYRSAWEGA